MAKKNNPKTDQNTLTLRVRVWVIEARHKSFTGGAYSWRCRDILTDATEADAVLRCNYLSEERVTSNYRYRAATLTFDDDGRKCVIY